MSSSKREAAELPANDLKVLSVPWADIEDSRDSYGCPPCCRDVINDEVSLQPYETGVAECEGSRDGLNLAFRLNAKVESPNAHRQRGPTDFSSLMTTSSATTTETKIPTRVSAPRTKLSPTPEGEARPPPPTSPAASDAPSPSSDSPAEDTEVDDDAYYRAAQEAAAAPGGYYDVFPDLSGAMAKREGPKKANFRPSQRTKSQRERKAEHKAAAQDERMRPQRRDEEVMTSEPSNSSASAAHPLHRNDSKQKRMASESMSVEAPSSKRPKNDLDSKTRSSLFPIREGNDPFALSQTLHPILFAPFLRSGTVPGEAPTPDQRGTPLPEVVMSEEEIKSRTASRTKQVAIGKGTIGYRNYCTLVKRCKRTTADPQTPDVRENSSKRDFDAKISLWRKALHAYDSMTV